ncbi:site-specific integrase [Pseudomonas sp. WS 5407]|uniref:tyrosine-type recombinase/integrase n=1 Tax=Pseudomonas sp. WS 5407 TaxID=2717496 RepID=UPI00147545AD|nr:site-specific integrase [Pseudomonas sp. WS 5407]NMX46109.1 site-specific integrase [Pseudomonas sp. WS 5407]
MTQSKTLTIALSDAEIRRHAASEVRDLRDARQPAFRFRYKKDRTKGSWYLVVGSAWNKIANYPDLNTKQMLAALPAVRARLVTEPEAGTAIGTWATVGQLLEWFDDRMGRDRNLSVKRKTTARSVMSKHLRPRLGDLLLSSVNKSEIDQRLMWPLQAELSLEYLRLIFRLLVLAFRQAARLGLIETNPMNAIRFSDFSKTKIKPKAARLRDVQVEEVLTGLATKFNSAPADAMLALMMLCHGSRAGETRMAEWSDFSFEERQWHIPAEHTKTRCQLTLPLTAQVCALLKRYHAAQASTGYQGKYLFPSRGGKPLTDSQACAVFTRLAGGEWTSHDLRKVARTGWVDLGVDFLIGELLLNHAMGHNVQAYIHTWVEAGKREALEKWHEWLDGRGFAAIHTIAEPLCEVSRIPVDATNCAASSQINDKP